MSEKKIIHNIFLFFLQFPSGSRKQYLKILILKPVAKKKNSMVTFADVFRSKSKYQLYFQWKNSFLDF